MITIQTEAIQWGKKQLRGHMLDKRRTFCTLQTVAWDQQLVDHFRSWSVYQNCDTIMFYVAMPDEAQTELLISDALKRGKQVYVPLLGEKYGEMSAAGIASLDELVVGKYGLKMPRRDKITAVAPDAIDVIVVPGVAFDRSGNRLGMGAGYYDRFFPKTRCGVLLGLAWGFQVIEEVPGEVHDVRMQYLLTEEGFHTCCAG